jgi:hypothetical protein
MIGATIRYIRVNRTWIVKIFCSSAIAFILAQWVILLQKQLSLPILIATGIIASLAIAALCLLLLVAWCFFDTRSRLLAIALESNMTIDDYIKTEQYLQNRDEILSNEIITGWFH